MNHKDETREGGQEGEAETEVVDAKKDGRPLQTGAESDADRLSLSLTSKR